MAGIQITYALDGSTVPQSFTATGTYDPTGTTNPPPVTCTLGGRAANSVSFNTTALTWAAQFSGLNPGPGLTLHIDITSTAAHDDEPDITVGGTTDPGLTIDPPPAPPDSREPFAVVSYPVTGTYDKKNKGIGVVCMIVTRNGKKLGTIQYAAAADLKGNGTWSATLQVVSPGQGKPFTIIAIMLDADGNPVARSGRISPNAP